MMPILYNLFQKIIPNLFQDYPDAKTGERNYKKLQTNGLQIQ